MREIRKLNLVKDVAENGYCTGCGICESIASETHIQVKISTLGYLRPEIKQSVDLQVLDEIKAVCPGINIKHSAPQKNQDVIWGPLIQVSTGHAVDETVRYQGSSGGVISALAIYLLESGKVSFVAQNAVSKNDPLTNELQISRNAADVLHAAGSRYAPSAPLRRIKELFQTGEQFAFIGKPCDVAALRNYLVIHPTLKKQVPYMLSFMCAGIPSQLGTNEILNQFSIKPDEVKSMRYRGEGWPGKAKVVTHQDEVYEMDYEASWGSILNKHLQFRCKICPDGTGEFADVVCADAWYGKDGYPDFEEQAGRSLVIGRTAIGAALINEAANKLSIVINPLPVEEIAKMQPYQQHRKSVVLARWIASKLVNQFAPSYQNLGLIRASFKVSPINWLRNGYGTYKRVRKEQQ
jgi:coenzyme F420 hydrogenase subunit beta